MDIVPDSDAAQAPVTPPPSPEATVASEPVVVEAPKEVEGSLAEHEAQLEARDDKGRYAKPRHRAKSQQAGPEDVPRIAELTKKWRDAEAKIADLEKRVPVQAKPEIPRPQLREVPQVEPGQFAEEEPKLEQFADKDDPYAAWIRATNAYDRKKEAFEAAEVRKQTSADAAQTQNRAEMQKWFHERETSFGENFRNYVMTQSMTQESFDALMLAAKNRPDLPPALHAAILMDQERGPEFALKLALEDEFFEDMYLLTEGRKVTGPLVALVQRRLSRMAPAADTGSVAPVPKAQFAPRPPSPVRTAPQKPAETPPKDEDSLAAHTAFYGKKTMR